MSRSQSTRECLEQIPNAFLHFVHDGCLWMFAPERFMRWSPARGAGEEKDEWNPTPYIWDFGARVVVPEHWLAWLSIIVGMRKTDDRRPLNPIGVHQDKTLVFEGVLGFGERRKLVVQPEHPFRGEDLVVVMGAPFLHVWNLSVGTIPQIKPRKDEEGRDRPWPGSVFGGEFPVNFRFDTAMPRQNISLDIEVGLPEDGGQNMAGSFEVRVELRGTELVERKNT